jgi:hypothetical protein
MTYGRAGGTGRLAGLVSALVLLVSLLLPAGVLAEEPPLISRMPGPLKLACRDAENVETCGFLVAGLNAYFKPAFQFEQRFATAAKVVLDLQGGGQPSDADCDACVQKVQDVEAYLATDPGAGFPNGPPSNVELLIETLQTACDRHFRSPPQVEQCKAELNAYAPTVTDVVLATYPPLSFCRLNQVRACAPPD